MKRLKGKTMRVSMFDKQFAGALRAGTKTNTIRRVRKDPLRVGEEIAVRIWEGAPYSSPQCQIGVTRIVRIEPVQVTERGVSLNGGKLLAKKDLDALVRAEGFGSWEEMRTWFLDHTGLPTEGMVSITFEPVR